MYQLYNTSPSSFLLALGSHFHFSLSCIGEGNGNPPQCSCLENPRDGGAWWSAIYGVTQSQTQLKRLSSSSSSSGLKKADCQRIDAFELWCWRRLLRVPWTIKRFNQFILKEISLGCSLIDRTDVEAETLILWPPDAKNKFI